MLRRIDDWQLARRLESAISREQHEPLLSEHAFARAANIAAGQPLALELWGGLFSLTHPPRRVLTLSLGASAGTQ